MDIPRLVRFLVSMDRDVRRGDVGAILQAHFARETSMKVRHLSIHLLALLGGVVAFDHAFPLVVPESFISAVPRVWAACLAFAVAAGGLEWAWRRRERRLLAAAENAAGRSFGPADSTVARLGRP